MAKAISKAKKKKWYTLLAPKLLNEKEIGEAYVADPNDLVGRRVSMNLMEITGNRKVQNINFECEVKQVKNGKGKTFARGFEMNPGSIKRYVRKGRDRIDDSFVLKTKDGFRVRVKPMIMTTNNTSKSVLTRIRNTTKSKLGKVFAQNTYNNLLDSALKFDLQKKMKKGLNTIYPVRNFEIRYMKLIDKNVSPDSDEEVQEEAEEDSEEPEEKEEDSQEESEESEEASDDSEEKE